SAASTLVPPRSTASAIVIWSAYRPTSCSYERLVARMLQPVRGGATIDRQGGRRMSDDNELLMVRAAELYYDDNKTQDEIGALLGITRWKVGRLLTQARQTGIVRIDIVHPRARRLGLERDLCAQFGLKDAVVIPAADAEDLNANVARAAADYLTALRPVPRTRRVSWGRALGAGADRLPRGRSQ